MYKITRKIKPKDPRVPSAVSSPYSTIHLSIHLDTSTHWTQKAGIYSFARWVVGLFFAGSATTVAGFRSKVEECMAY